MHNRHQPISVQTARNLLAAGYGKMEEMPPTREGGPSYAAFMISIEEMEQMGEEKRQAFGVQPFYESILARRAQSRGEQEP